MSPGSRKQPEFEMMAPGESLVASRPRCRTRLFAGRSQRQLLAAKRRPAASIKDRWAASSSLCGHNVAGPIPYSYRRAARCYSDSPSMVRRYAVHLPGTLPQRQILRRRSSWLSGLVATAGPPRLKPRLYLFNANTYCLFVHACDTSSTALPTYT